MLSAANPVDHVVDKPVLQWLHDLPLFLSSDGTLWVVSNATIMLFFSAFVTALIIIPAARKIQTGKARTIDDLRTQGLWANLVETVCLYLRNEVFASVLGEKTDKYTPVLWTLFWFILVNNMLGLIPILDITAAIGSLTGLHIGYHGHGIGGTATQSIWVTGALALFAAAFYMGNALKEDPIGFLKHLTGGAPWFMWVIMIPVEIAGYCIKPFALAIRLFANMTGGHLVIAVLLGFVKTAFDAMGPAGAVGLGIPSVLGATGINILEVLVGFIQAYIFTFLTCLFLAQLVTHSHDEHHEHDMGDHGVHAHPHDAIAMEDVKIRQTHMAG
jgi:F-type H+-transporting ATPase subunit a